MFTTFSSGKCLYLKTGKTTQRMSIRQRHIDSDNHEKNTDALYKFVCRMAWMER